MCITMFNKDELLKEIKIENSHQRNEEILRLLYVKYIDTQSKRDITKAITELNMVNNEFEYQKIIEKLVANLDNNEYNNSRGVFKKWIKLK